LKDPRLVAQTFWAAVHGVASLQVAKGNDRWMDWADLDQRASTAIDAAIRGMERDRPAVHSRTHKRTGVK
jgi:hypothetical protein